MSRAEKNKYLQFLGKNCRQNLSIAKSHKCNMPKHVFLLINGQSLKKGDIPIRILGIPHCYLNTF